MRFGSRLALSTVLVATLLVAIVLVVVERRVTERVRAEDAALPAADAEQLLARVRRDIVVAGAVTILVGLGLARLLSRQAAAPVEALRDVARAMAEGDLSRRPPLLGTGETGELAEALRRLGEQLEASQASAQAEEALLVNLTESLNEGVVAVDARQQVVRINETARQLLRLRDPVPFPADYLPRDRTLREALAAVLGGRDAVPGEIRVDDRALSLAARPLPGGGAVLALYDLTPFRRLEAVRRDFVANVSHELRTPLTVISGFVETLQDEALPPELRAQFLGMAAANVRRMQRIVDDLLDLSRIESGGWLPNPSELDVRALATEVVGPLLEQAHAKGVGLDVAVSDGARTVYADPTAVRQILSNLAENALRHTATGTVTLFTEAEDGGTWIGVRDTGTGIPAEHLPRIFERFYRADPSRSREAGGTGLGLSIVRHLAEAHGGRVRAESVVDGGTTIAAWFPPAAADPDRAVAERPADLGARLSA
jgi:signal transduction histidine kinase/HAMP domain-containing protein